MVLPSSFLLIYTLSFLIFVFMLKRETSAEMYQAVVQRFIDAPFRQEPREAFRDVRGGADVYEWIVKVFLPQVYGEQPSPLERGAYCTERSKCLLNQGDVQSDRQCAGSLVAGTNNCPSYMGSGTDCCETCVGPKCSNLVVATRIGDLSNTTSVEDVSENCAVPMQRWLQDLHQWNRPGNPNTRRLQQGQNSAIARDFVYCPEWLSKVQSDLETRSAETGTPVMLARFNRMIMSRMSMKRVAFVNSDSRAFANAYPRMVATTRTSAYSYAGDGENTKSFGPDLQYNYQEGEGFSNAGGFIQHIDFETSKDHVFDLLATLKRHHWFDLNQGSFVLEMLTYNGNVDNFLYVAFIFEHDFTGSTKVSVEACPLDLSLHDASNPSTWVRFVIFLIVLCFFCYFLKAEVEDMLVSVSGYWSDPLAIMQVLSLSLTAVSLVMYLMVSLSYTYINFEFPLALNMEERFNEFQDLANLAMGMERFNTVMAVNTFVVCLRGVAAAVVLVPQLGAVVDSLGHVKYTFMAWFALYIAMLLGYSFAGLFVFGPRSKDFCTFTDSFITSVKVMSGGRIFNSLQKSDADVAFTCFIVFVIPFMIVHEVFYSILLSGYLRDREIKSKNSEPDNYPLLRIALMVKTWVRRYTNKCFTALQFLRGRGGGALARVNKDLVTIQRDRRPTKLRMREVVYEKKQGDGVGNYINVWDDVTWRVANPYYTGGLAQFYVADAKQGGPAAEARVEPGFRLVEIQSQGKRDREKFRTVNALGHPKDPVQLLKDEEQHLPVTLVFEGRPSPPLWEPIGFTIFLALFLQFLITVIRVPDSYGLTAVFEDSWLKPSWTRFNPQQEIDFRTMSDTLDIPKWLSASVDAGYGCVAGVGSGTDTTAMKCQPEANDVPRDGWFLWRGAGETGQAVSTEGGVQTISALATAPKAAAGMSLGFIPLTPPVGFTGEEYICATENDAQEGNCPECVMSKTCRCLGQVKYGYNMNWTQWLPVAGEIKCAKETFEVEPPPSQANICVCQVQKRRITQAIRTQDYNIGVMPNNHVRLTFQTPCFKANPKERHKATYPYVWHPAQASEYGCADRACMLQAKEEELVCLDFQGKAQSIDKMSGGYTGTTYSFSKSGTYRNMGGVAIGLGRTKKEAGMVAAILQQDQILSRVSVSSVFESVSYNAIYDMFMYSSVSFGLMPTGKLNKEVKTVAFALNTFSPGAMSSAESVRIWTWFCFAFFIIAALVTFVVWIRAVYTQYRITKALRRRWYLTFPDFIADDWWNIVDTAIVALDIAVISQLCSMMLLDSTVSVKDGVGSWTNSFSFVPIVDMKIMDEVDDFQRAADIFSNLAGFAAIRGIFLVVRIMKYLPVLNILQPVMSALSFAKTELLITLGIHAFILVGFLVMVSYRFGVTMPAFSTMTGAFFNLVLFITGRFDFSVQASNGPLFWAFIFPIFQVFLLLFSGMLLAIITSRWMDARRDAQEPQFNAGKHWQRLLRRIGLQDKASESDQAGETKLDSRFWKDLSILPYLSTLEESGKVKIAAHAEAETGKNKKGGKDDDHGTPRPPPRSAAQDDDDEANGPHTFKFESLEDRARFVRTFKKAHMEMASRMCKVAKERQEDTGRGVGLDEGRSSVAGHPSPKSRASTDSKRPRSRDSKGGKGLAAAGRRLKIKDKDAEAALERGFAGIIEDPVPDNKIRDVRRMLEDALGEKEEPLEEVWMDALVTAMEECGGLEHAQQLFMPLPCLKPRKPADWTAFNDRKEKMEGRLRTFIQLLQVEARLERVNFLKVMAMEKERVLKQQSLVLTDYLDTLEKQIEKVTDSRNKLQETSRHGAAG